MQMHEASAGRAAGVWRLSLDDYRNPRGLAGLLSDHADAVMAQVEPDDRGREGTRVTEDLFRALTDINADGHATRYPRRLRDADRDRRRRRSGRAARRRRVPGRGRLVHAPVRHRPDRAGRLRRHQPRGAAPLLAEDRGPGRRLADPRVQERARLAVPPASRPTASRAIRRTCCRRPAPRNATAGCSAATRPGASAMAAAGRTSWRWSTRAWPRGPARCSASSTSGRARSRERLRDEQARLQGTDAEVGAGHGDREGADGRRCSGGG